MGYHPENVEIPLGEIKVEQRRTEEGGIEHIAVIPPKLVAEAASRMDYNSLGDFINNLSLEIDIDGNADFLRDRFMLASFLHTASMHLDDARNALKSAWGVCAKYMSRTKGGYNGK